MTPQHNLLSRLYPSLKTGAEKLHAESIPLGPTLLDFWSWSTSDLVSNATRGVLAGIAFKDLKNAVKQAATPSG